MSSGTLTTPPRAIPRLVVDTGVASFIYKWHPEFAPRYVELVRGSALIISFMTLAEMRNGALQANWGTQRRTALEAYLGEFAVVHSDDRMCVVWASIKNESQSKGRPINSADAWIAASAIVLGVPLVTNNPKDYRHLDGIEIISAILA